MSIKVVYTCPLGSKCQEIVGDEMHQCSWYVNLKGSDPQSGNDIDEYRCAMSWQPVLAVAQNTSIIQTSAAVHSLKTDTAKRQNEAIEVLRNAEVIKHN